MYSLHANMLYVDHVLDLNINAQYVERVTRKMNVLDSSSRDKVYKLLYFFFVVKKKVVISIHKLITIV
jgi:hypothetical protein